MHDFQPFPIELVEINPFTKLNNQWALISSGNKIEYNTMTVSWGGFGVIWGKNVVYIFIRDSRYSKELIDDGVFFSMAFLDEKYKDVLGYCGTKSGRDSDDKFADAGLTPAFRHGIPYPDEANLVIMCKKMAAVPMPEDTFIDASIKEKWYKDGDFHTMYVGEIIEVTAR